MENSTCSSNYSLNCTTENPDEDNSPAILPYILVACYTVTCVLGLLGNGLVIYVVLCFAKMKTVANMYILNLAIADVLFLFGLPFLIATTLLRHWVFGFAMCKLFFVLYSINWFTSVFTLTVMSADRYLAVCYPIASVKYRNPKVSRIVCFCVWSVSFLVMLPIMLYAKTIDNHNLPGKKTCTIEWPKNQAVPNDKAFTWYSLLLGFAIPVALISVFYILVILRLRTVGPIKKSKEKKKTHRKVTRMVLTVIAVYVISWLPYWTFQVHLTLAPRNSNQIPEWKLNMFNGFTALSYANSMLNPLLYAFLSDNFRKSFMKAFKCASPSEANKTLYAETSMFPRQSHQGNKCCSQDVTNITESFEFTTNTNTTTTMVRYDNNDPSSALCNNEECGENGGMEYTDDEAV